jgi:hypothetical protein
MTTGDSMKQNLHFLFDTVGYLDYVLRVSLVTKRVTETKYANEKKTSFEQM